MRVVTPLVILAAVCAALFHAGPQQALACTCEQMSAREATLRRQVDRFDAMLVGYVESVQPNVGAQRRTTATVKVEHRYTGITARTIELVTPHSSACGAALQDKKRYFLALTGGDGDYIVHACGVIPIYENGPTPSGREVLDTLARISPPSEVGGGASPWIIAGYFVASLLAIGALAGFSASRQSRRSARPSA